MKASHGVISVNCHIGAEAARDLYKYISENLIEGLTWCDISEMPYRS